MKTELKPCPFCGGKAKHRVMDDGYHYVICNGDCKVMPSTLRYGSEAEAILVWNTRAGEEEKTCHVIDEHCNGAHMEDCCVQFSCHHVAYGTANDYAYCPGCGAKVIEQ